MAKCVARQSDEDASCLLCLKGIKYGTRFASRGLGNCWRFEGGILERAEFSEGTDLKLGVTPQR